MELLEYMEAIAKEAHKYCPPDHPAGEHDYTGHIQAAREYGYFFWHQGVASFHSPEDIVRGIVAIGGDPRKGEWKGHPHPSDVLEYLKKEDV